MLTEKKAYWLAVVTACDLTIPGVPPLNESFINEAAWKEFAEIYGSNPPAQPLITNKETAQLLRWRIGCPIIIPIPLIP